MRLPCGEPGDADVGGRRPGLVVGRHDHQRVAFPVAARLAHVVLEGLAQRRAPVHRHDARLVHHLEVQDDVARRLHDADAVVVAVGHHRRRHAARDAAVPRVEVLPVIPGLGLARERPAALHQRRQALALCRHLGQPAVRRIDDERGLALHGGRVGHARLERPAEVALRDGRRMCVTAPGRRRQPLLVFRFGEKGLAGVARRRRGAARAAAAAAALQRHGADERNRPHSGQIGVAPGRLGVRPALGRLDEMVGLAGRPGLPAGGDDEERGCEAAKRSVS